MNKNKKHSSLANDYVGDILKIFTPYMTFEYEKFFLPKRDVIFRIKFAK
jgi:hypothetical protein